MRYEPKDANGILIPDGEYDAEISEAVEKRSKSGNDMMELKVKVWANGGGPRIVFDYIVVPSSLYKLKQIAGATGQMSTFESGEMGVDEVRNKSVRVSIKTQADKEGKFPDKNVVARYLPQEAGAKPTHHERVPGSDDDGPDF